MFLGITSELDSTLAAAAAIRGGGEGGRVVEEATEPIGGMKPGTSGLRKKVGFCVVVFGVRGCWLLGRMHSSLRC